jgi:hypothetical protein
MSHVRMFLGSLTFSLLFLSAPAQGQSPLSRLSLFKHLEADPSKTYQLLESHGPCLILAATFSGENAERQSQALVLELRRDFKLPAYRHTMAWDYSQSIQGRGVDSYGRPLQMKHANYEKREEIAVLIGDFPDIQDVAAQKTLEQIRYIKPICLDPEHIVKNGQTNARTFAGWRFASAQLLSNDEEKKRRGPLGKAFLTLNPLLPPEYFRPKGVDPMVERMNEPLEFNLLKCPGKFTVKVATFGGTMISLPSEVDKIEKGEKRLQSRLEKAALDAHNLTAALRAKGYEAYEFHDEEKSIVCVGNFQEVARPILDEMGRPLASGKMQLYDEVRAVVETFGTTVHDRNGIPTTVPQRSLVGIQFDPNPVPMEVPQRSIAATYDNSRLSRR